ncbi:hypothetical protein E2P64_08335 [Candidatus Bathyarchaeota archaeon]|nr:hypothetical protein E2P64_08335 [Candidatus Bathyarchaeota archaeon]
MKQELLTVDVPNKNGRVYPRAIVEREVARIKRDFIAENRWIIAREQMETSTFDLRKAVAVGKDLFFEGDKLFVDVEILHQLPFASEIEEGLKNGTLSVRTSGMGTLHEQKDGTYLVGEDWELIHCFVTPNPA